MANAKMVRSWNIRHMIKGWKNWVCSVLKGEDFTATLLLSTTASWQGTEKMELKSSQMCTEMLLRVERQEKMNTQAGTHEKFWLNTRTFIIYRCLKLEQVTQRGWWISALGDTQNLTRQDTEQPCSNCPALSGCLDEAASGVLFLAGDSLSGFQMYYISLKFDVPSVLPLSTVHVRNKDWWY